MQYDLQTEDVTSIRRRLRFTVPSDVVNKELDQAYRSLKKRARLPGFRPGKAPRQVLEARFGKQIAGDVASRLIDLAFREAASDLELAGQPALEEQGDVKKGVDLTFIIGVDIKPELELDGYSGLTVEYPLGKVTDEDVEASIQRILHGQARIAEVTDDRPVEEGDRVLTELKLVAGDEILADDAGTIVQTRGERFYPGVEALLLGLSKGGEKSGTVTIGEDSQLENLKGREVEATVKVLGVQALQVPELDDALSEELGYEGGADGMQAAIRMGLEEQVNEAARNQARVALLQKLVDANAFDVPQGMIDEQFNALVEELKVRRQYQGQDPRSIRFSDAEVQDLRGRALFAAKASLILAAVARQEEIDVTEADLDAKVEEIAGSRGQNAEAIRAYLQREQAFGVLRTRILEEKTLEFLLEAAELKEVDPADAAAAAAVAAAEQAAAAPEEPATAKPAAKPAAKKASKKKAAKKEEAPAAEATTEVGHWTKSMLKKELLEVAKAAGLGVTSKNTKAQIIEALEAAG